MTRTSEAGKFTCDCGCGGELSEATVALGWRFLRGHKPVVVKKRREIKLRALPPTGVVDCNIPVMCRFAQSQLNLLASQLDAAKAEMLRTQDIVMKLQVQYGNWAAITAAFARMDTQEAAPQ